MKKILKKSLLSTLVLVMFLSFNGTRLNAKNNVAQKSIVELIEISTPYVKRVYQGFIIEKESELEQKIGKEHLESLKKHLEKQNLEIANERNRDAVDSSHINLIRKLGAKVERPFWGTRITTYSLQQTKGLKALSKAFAGDASSDEAAVMVLSLGYGVASFVPSPLAPVNAVASLIFGVASAIKSSDKDTWRLVDDKIEEKLNSGRTSVIVDINGWYRNVVVK